VECQARARAFKSPGLLSLPARSLNLLDSSIARRRFQMGLRYKGDIEKNFLFCFSIDNLTNNKTKKQIKEEREKKTKH
jgi:hypothetical protein